MRKPRTRAIAQPRTKKPSSARRRCAMARYEHRFCQVVNASYLGAHHVWLEFNDGRKGIVDLADELHGEGFIELRDVARFHEMYLDDVLASLAWPDGPDLAPE